MKTRIRWFAIITIFALLLSSCTIDVTQPETQSPGTEPTQTTTKQAPDWGTQTKTTGCKPQGYLQDKACTPGAIFSKITKKEVCTPGYASSVRNVPTSLKNKVYAAYGIKNRRPGQYEVDHLISLQLGGTNDISNLWPEAVSPKPGSKDKDRVENYLNDQVCDGKMSLRDAQIAISTDWYAVYKTMPSSAKDKKGGEDSTD